MKVVNSTLGFHVVAISMRNNGVPNIRELESLVVLDQHSPALPESHPFQNVGQGYWSSTTSVYDTSYAWVLYSDDGKVGVGFKKKADFGVWPVRS